MSSSFARGTWSSQTSASPKRMADAIFNSSFVKRKIKKDGREQNDGVMGGVPKPASPLRGGGETREDFFCLLDLKAWAIV